MEKIIQIFFIVMTSSFLYLSNLVLLLNMENLKFFTFPDHMVSSICFYSTSTTLEILSSNLKKSNAILVSFLTGNCPFDSMFNFMLIKCYQSSSTWKCLEIPIKDSCITRNISFIEHMFYQLLSIDLLFSIITKYLYLTCSKKKYNDKWPYRS